MLPVATHTYKNHRIALYADDSPESPRDWDTLGTLVCWHRRYRLGDALPEALRSSRPHHHDADSLDRFQAWMHQQRRMLLILPVYLYDHSGLALATTPFSCPWDSGQVGWILASHARIRTAFGVKRLSAKVLARATVHAQFLLSKGITSLEINLFPKVYDRFRWKCHDFPSKEVKRTTHFNRTYLKFACVGLGGRD